MPYEQQYDAPNIVVVVISPSPAAPTAIIPEQTNSFLPSPIHLILLFLLFAFIITLIADNLERRHPRQRDERRRESRNPLFFFYLLFLLLPLPFLLANVKVRTTGFVVL